ncbi:hypothetical protein F4778DRAFT_797634 [Xylariomycetidae sp. FL2044]|nr:hypothetical protein F4778DRAFT_797634 [Xylariomycetidae sp. FL2044]
MSTWGSMRRVFLSDEEMGKKDDDHKTSKNGTLRPPNWHPARVPPRRFLKRIGVVMFVACMVYLFIRNIPVLGPDSRMRRPIYPYSEFPPPLDKTNSYEHKPPSQAPGRSPLSRSPERNFNGPVKFYELATSLHAIAGTRGSMVNNRNVLFAASSLKSASTLLPMACQMGAELKNFVHFALMTRSEIELKELQEINGVDESCQIIFHDARPDYVQISTDERMETAVFRAFHHINNYMHPQAILVDGSNDEEHFFQRSSRQHAQITKNTLVELPSQPTKKLEWLTKLDSAALRAWDKIHIDILIQARAGASGSLIRLLRSLGETDFMSSSVPHLTIELPHDIDPPTKKFLEDFTWPPKHVPNPTNARYLSLRHRIPHKYMDEEESSARLLESFWPANPQLSHVLVLSPQVELSPNFFHYIKYSLLEYRYSTVSTFQHWDQRIFGISLEQPVKLLSGTQAFSPPTLLEPANSGDGEHEEESTPFLWQSPNSNAMLFLGEKWMELHDFVSRSLEAQHKINPVPSILSEKVVSTQHPSWLEHALRLARARNYLTLYPGVGTAQNLATVHSELYHLPEEYASHEETPKALLQDDASDEEIENVRRKLQTGSDIPIASMSLLESLPNEGSLRAIGDLPIVMWDGRTADLEEINGSTEKFFWEFREQLGGCNDDDPQKTIKASQELSTRDLFCAAE